MFKFSPSVATKTHAGQQASVWLLKTGLTSGDGHDSRESDKFLLVSADRCACTWRTLYLQAADRSCDSGFRFVFQHSRCRRPPSWKKRAKLWCRSYVLLLLSLWLFFFFHITLSLNTTVTALAHIYFKLRSVRFYHCPVAADNNILQFHGFWFSDLIVTRLIGEIHCGICRKHVF